METNEQSLDRRSDITPSEQFGKKFISNRTSRTLEKLEEKAITTAMEYRRVRFLQDQAQENISEIGVKSTLKMASDVDMMNRIKDTAETATPAQRAKIEAEIDRHLDYLAETARISRAEVVRSLAEDVQYREGWLQRLLD